MRATEGPGTGRDRPDRPATGNNRKAIAGPFERVTFHNPEGGFCVLRVKLRGQRDLVAVVGHAAMIPAGEFVQASGNWINDRTHGVQFKAAFLRAAPPTTLEGIERYLGSGMIKGIHRPGVREEARGGVRRGGHGVAVVVVLTLMVGLLTPPVGASPYMVSPIGRLPVERVLRGALPLFIPLLLALLVVTPAPALSTWLPGPFFR